MRLANSLRQRKPRDLGARIFAGALVFSLAAHAASGAYLVWRQDDRMGAVQLPSLAVSVNIEASNILDSSEMIAAGDPGDLVKPKPDLQQPEEPIEPSSTGTELDEEAEKPRLAEEAEEARQAAEAEERRLAEEAEKQRIAEEAEKARQAAEAEKARLAEEAKQRRLAEEAAARRRAEAAEKARLARQAEERRQIAEQKRQEEAKRQAEAEAERRKAAERRREAREREKEKREATRSGSRGRGGRSESGESAARVSASQGSLRNYGALVRSRIARKQRSIGRRGRTVIVLSISSSGQLQSAGVARSSGNGTVDRAILSAVRSASPFPPPPGGAARNFTIPIEIR